jgi:PAS domain S-box-containing protein
VAQCLTRSDKADEDSAPVARRVAACSRPAACAGGAAAASLGGLGLLGWLTPWPGLARLVPASLPMAPVTALELLLLATALMLEARRPSPRRTGAAALIVLTATGFALVAPLAGLPAWPDSLLVPNPGTFAGVPTARMSPLTAVSLLLASVGLLCVAAGPRFRAAVALGGPLGSIVCLVGVVVALGYGYGAPLLYGGAVVPMALSTALGVASLGAALVALAPIDSLPVRPLRGPSANARMLRAFLPLAPAVVIVDLLLTQFGSINPALQAALEGLLSATVVAAVVFFAARALSRALDRAEAERERARRDVDRLAAIVESSTDAIWARDLGASITAWNAGAERLFGYAADEMLGRSAILLHPGSENPLPQTLEKLRRGEPIGHAEATLIGKDGSAVTAFISESPLYDAQGRLVGVSAIARDVTEQRRAERMLRESESKLRALFESDVAGILFGDIHGNILDANDKLLAMSGYTRADKDAGLSWIDLTPPEFLALDEASIAEARARGACTPYEKQYIRKDGTRIWVLVGYVLLEPERQRSVAFVIDIDARKRAEEELLRSEERFARVFQSRLVAIGVSELASGRLIDVNDRCAEFFGYTREEMIGRTVFELGMWADDSERERLVARLAPDGTLSQGEARFRRKTGEIRHAMVSMEAVTLPGIPDPLNMVMLVDLTERRQLEAQLSQSQKLEAIGRLAGGVAHDFNNLLGVILGYGDLLLRDASGSQRARVEQILKASQRAAGLTRQLLAFSRKQIVDPRVLDLNALLADVEKMLGRLIGEDVALSLAPGADLGRVKADPGQLEQVVMNLAINARDVMPDGGLLRIETANVYLDAGYASQHPPMPAGRYVMLAVSDTGSGIERELLDKIFEPFFTTKEPGKGTGLGLSTVYGIVKQAGGFVWVYSEVGRGTTFKIYLPRVDEAAVAAAPKRDVGPLRGTETVLLVEDEDSLREISREILAGNGYRVLEASDGNAAVTVARAHAGPIHLLLTDVVMPGISGRELAETLLPTRAEMRVLYMSGYTEDLIAHRGVLEAGTLLLPKPFTASTLLQRVREALAGGSRKGA